MKKPNSPFPSSRILEIWCWNRLTRSRLNALHPIKHESFKWKNNMQWRFFEIKGRWIEKLFVREGYTIKRWWQRKTESWIAWFMPESNGNEAKERRNEDHTKLLEEKLQTSEGKLPDPKTLSAWTHNFSKIPEITFGDLYNYLVGKEDYSPKIFIRSKVFLASGCSVMATLLT